MDWNTVETFSDVIAAAARQYGGKVAFRDQRRSLTYIEYSHEVSQIASWLAEQDIRAGARIAIFSQNRIEVPVLLGLCSAGFIPVPLNWRLPAEDIAGLIADCDPDVVFVEDRYLAVAAVVFGHGKKVPIISLGTAVGSFPSYDAIRDNLRPGKGQAAQAIINPNDPCCIIYTSGTTGKPKGVVLTHRGVVGNCKDLAREAFGFRDNDVSLMAMPLFHVGGICYYLFPSFAAGCTTSIRERFDPEDVIFALRSEKVTIIHLVPTMVADLLSRPHFAESATSLRLVVYAGSSMPIDVLRRAIATLKQCRFVQAYGSTEGGSITALAAETHELAIADPTKEGLLRSCGRPIGDTKVSIDRQSDNTDPIGEILVRSSKYMLGYWQQEEATKERFEGEWLRTGDLGYIDDNGYVYIVDRKNDMVISGGENIFPFEVEEVIRLDPRVGDVAVFGVPDKRWVERLVAAVILKPSTYATPEDIIEHVRKHLPGYKTPKSVVFVSDLPKNPVGKVLRKQLRLNFAYLASD